MRLSPPSLGSSVKIEEGTLAFGNDKNLWIRKKRNDNNTYWSSFAELDLELGIPRNEEVNYNYLQIEWEIPDFGILSLSYINSGRITFQCFANNNEQLLYANVPLQKFDKLKNQIRLEALRGIVYDFSKNIVTDDDTIKNSILKMLQELNRFWRFIFNNLSELQLRYSVKNDYDFQAEVDFPLKKTFRPSKNDLNNLDIMKFEEDEESEQEPTPTPQPDEFKPIWRVKTEQEFIDEFGDDWRRSLSWLRGSDNMDYLFGKPVTNPNFDGENLPPTRIDTAEELGIDSGGDNLWILDSYMFKKIQNDQPEPIDVDDLEDGKLFCKSLDNVNTFLKTDSETTELLMYTNGWQFIQPTYWSNESFIIKATRKLLDLEISIIIELSYETGINIYYSKIKTQEVIAINDITNPTDFKSVIDEIREKVGIDNELSQELGYLEKVYSRDIWKTKKIKCAFVEQESTPKIGKLLLKGNLDTYLKISEDVDRLELNSDEFQYIQPWGIYDDKFFQFEDTYNLRTYGIYCKILLNYKTGIDIYFKNEKNNKILSSYNITSESVFLNAIADIRRFAGFSPFERELDLIALLLSEGIWRNRSIVCDFVSGLPKPKFAVGDKVTKINNKKRIFTITSITTFDDNEQQWDYDVVEDINGNQLSYWENQLELVSTELDTTNECDVDVSLIDSQYVGQFYQQNKNRIEALNPNISCLFLEALLSLSNYEKCGDGVEIPMPQPKKEEKEDLLSQIRNL